SEKPLRSEDRDHGRRQIAIQPKRRHGIHPLECASSKSSRRVTKTRVNKHGNGSEEILRGIKTAQCLPRGCRLWSRRVVPYSAHDAGFSVLRNSKLGDSLCRNCACG